MSRACQRPIWRANHFGSRKSIWTAPARARFSSRSRQPDCVTPICRKSRDCENASFRWSVDTKAPGSSARWVAAFNSAQLRPGQNVAVFGLGGVGLNSVMAAKISGASEIIGIDINESKFPLAMEVGCTRTISALDPKLVETVKDWTQGGVDFA